MTTRGFCCRPKARIDLKICHCYALAYQRTSSPQRSSRTNSSVAQPAGTASETSGGRPLSLTSSEVQQHEGWAETVDLVEQSAELGNDTLDEADLCLPVGVALLPQGAVLHSSLCAEDLRSWPSGWQRAVALRPAGARRGRGLLGGVS